MKKLLNVLVLSCALLSCQKNTNVSPTKTDDAAVLNLPPIGSQSFASTTVTTEAALKTAVANAHAGDVITISGTINLTSTLQLLASGTSSSKINLSGGTLNCSGIPSAGWGVKVNGSYWNIQNITIKNAPSCGIVFQSGGYNYAYKITSTGNKDSGIQVYNGGHDDNITYCTSSENYDTAAGGENADGFACKLSAGKNNKFDHCTAYHNSDDGWDLYGQPYTVSITNCTSTNNGYGGTGDGNGFKLGSAGQSVPHTVTTVHQVIIQNQVMMVTATQVTSLPPEVAAVVMATPCFIGFINNHSYWFSSQEAAESAASLFLDMCLFSVWITIGRDNLRMVLVFFTFAS